MTRCIMVGMGWRASCWYPTIRRRSDVQIVGYVEPSLPAREKAIAQWGAPPAGPWFASLEEALSSVQADWVMDNTPPAVHDAVARQAFAAGLDVLAEKPLSDDFAKARQTVAAGQQAKRIHMITQNFRFGSQPRATRKALAAGLIGEVGQCDVSFYMPWADIPGSYYVTQPYMLLNDMMVHHFDMMRYVLGVEPIGVQAVTWNPKWGWHKGDAAHSVVMDFAGGLHATHVCCGCSLGRQTSWNGSWQIEGSEGSIVWEGSDLWHSRMHRTPRPVHEKMLERWRPPEDSTLLDDVLAEFLNAVRERRAPECSGEDNLKTLAMVFAAIRSAKERRRVELAEIAGG